ncbi:MAG: hypothetical protein SP1CHLAM54_18070 [Chlamydiia bacterium]|nr:hypothetical protein [Chlamydiia bacterium]MCH9616693.1 hypothetical protein [Chlamydiia bacterium]
MSQVSPTRTISPLIQNKSEKPGIWRGRSLKYKALVMTGTLLTIGLIATAIIFAPNIHQAMKNSRVRAWTISAGTIVGSVVMGWLFYKNEPKPPEARQRQERAQMPKRTRPNPKPSWWYQPPKPIRSRQPGPVRSSRIEYF